MVIALDRSTVMNQSFGAGTQVSEALHTLVYETGQYGPSSSGPHPRPSINFSFLDFPGGSSSCSVTAACCVRDVVQTPNSSSFFAAANACQSACVSSDARPIAAALTKAAEFLMTAGGDSPRSILLVTDVSEPSDKTCQTDECGAAIAEATTLRDDIHLTVVAMGSADPSSALCLQQVASAAQRGATGSPVNALGYFQAGTQTALQSAVSTAMSGALCSGTLGSTPLSVNNLSVSIGQQNFYQSQTGEGWTY